jgi:DNA invertase Pin-like site-specific DNA recombinase
MQLTELRDYAARAGMQIHGEYTDTGISGAKASRPALDRLMVDAKMHRFNAVLCWRLDRWGRSLPDCLTSIGELDRLGIRFVIPGQGIDTDHDSPAGRLMLHIIGAVAQFERELIKERVVAGIKQAQAAGRHCGRPRRVFRRDQVLDMRSQGKSWAQISKALGVPAGTIRSALAKNPLVETGSGLVETKVSAG